RGIVLHKLMEEFLTGELSEDEEAVVARASLLLSQIAGGDAALPDPAEMGATALRTIRFPDLLRLPPQPLPEFSVWSQDGSVYVAGRADALAVEQDRVSVVLDWKSDAAPTAQDRAQHAAQLTDYRIMLGAHRAAIIYMTASEVWWL